MKKRNYFLAFFAECFFVWLGLLPANAQDKEPSGHVVVSFEKTTIGQGFMVEPEYVPFYENETIADVTLRALRGKGYQYNYDGTLKSGFYLSEISDPNRGEIRVPNYILKDIDQQQKNNTGLIMEETDIFRQDGVRLYKDNTPQYLGEFDYWIQSGWMYSVDGIYPKVSSCDIQPKDGQIVRWQFTMVNLGIDLYGDPAEKKPIDRDDLCDTLANVRKNSEILKDDEVKEAFDRCRKEAIALTASKEEYGRDIDILKKALGWNCLSEITWYDTENTRCSVKNGTDEKNIPFPETLKAVKSGTSITLKDGDSALSWKCPEGYHAKQAGVYTFYPVIPERYSVAENVVLPAYQVRVQKLGDVNGDDNTDDKDMEILLTCLRKSVEQDEEAASCDLNFDGTINLQDYSLLAGVMGKAEVSQEDDARIVLKLNDDKTTADIIVYGGTLDAVAFHLSYDSSIVSDVNFKAIMPFVLEKTGSDSQGSWYMIGSRNGSVPLSSIRGTRIGKISFQYTGDDKPDIKWGEGTDFLLEGKDAVGYCNGHRVNMQTEFDEEDRIKITGQLNNGTVRCAHFTGQTTTENGTEMEVVQLTFRHTDAENTAENRLRLSLWAGKNFTFIVGESCVNGEIQNPFDQEETDVWYAGGNNRNAGRFTLGQSPQKESCVLYGKLKVGENVKYYKILVHRNGYAAVSYNHSAKEPYIVSEWDDNNPNVISAPWNPEDFNLQEWDSEGNPI
ncbi:MAG: dockerin type I domain-containing protein, partial [Eubacterium sp.]|nr:dockerin type I domain-containing protein [Eubacterium sp.]